MSQPPTFDRLSDLIAAAAGVVEQTDLELVLRRLVTEAIAATGARYGALGVIGEYGVLSDFLYEGIPPDDAIRIGLLPTGHGVLGTVIRLNETIRVDQISSHPDAVGFPEHHPPMGSFLGVPVAVGDIAFGNLYLTEKEGGFTEQDVTVVEALSRIAGAAVKTARLQDRLRRVAVVEDRQRIARELHDSVIQEMFAVGLGLQGLALLMDNPQAEATLLDAVDRLDGSVETLRRYIFELKGRGDSRPTLDDRLQEVIARMASAYPTRVRVSMEIDHVVDGPLEDEIVAVVTESLSNALRHASAQKVEVLVIVHQELCEIQVSDDGTGFDVEAASGGMGVENLRARVAKRHGDISISSSGLGTDLVVTLPVS
jgi:two-component system, NarL family, sensor histidine kinase DevS